MSWGLTDMYHDTAERFWKRINKSNECWIWTGRKNKDGYGTTYWNGKSALAHRVAWELTYGLIPESMCILHKCDNPQCCNPDHLFLGTRTDNHVDMVQKGRIARGDRNGMRLHPENIPCGEKCGMAKLSAEQVIEIRCRYKPWVVSMSMLAKEFNVDRSTIRKIVSGQRWRHLLQEASK